MKLLRLSVLLLAGLTAVARAEPSAEASLAIKADLAKARAALAQRDTPAVVEALDDAMRHLSNADEESLQALTAFEDQFRDTLAKATAEPAVSSPPASPEPVPPPPDQPAPAVPAAPPGDAERGAAAGEDLTIWWRTSWSRTQGAEVVEQRTKAGERACALRIHHDGDVLLFRWRKGRDPLLLVSHPGWRFGSREGTLTVGIGAGRTAPGASPGGGASVQLAATGHQDWIRATLDPPIADLLSREREVTVDFPDGQASSVSFPVDRSRTPAIVRGLQDCKTAIGVGS
ncbi:MAG: hypothetical protein JOY66_09665 [Acetobacteraceae bacterium]|nr:hypothetical protein [Acetobacteraceae bacterium]